MGIHTASLRTDREFAAREAADRLLSVIEELERTAALLETAGQPSLHHRARTVQASASRLQADVGEVIGELVKERVIEEVAAARSQRTPERRLTVA